MIYLHIISRLLKKSDVLPSIHHVNGKFLSGAVVALLLEEDWETVVADPHGLGGGGEGQLVVAARVAEYLPARATVML